MKMRMHKNVLAIAAFCSYLLVGCNQPENMNDQPENDSLTLKTDSMDFDKMKAELKEKYSIAIAKLDKEIDVLEAKLQSTEEKGEAEIENSISELKNERNVLNERMQEVESTMESTWDEWKSNAEDLLKQTEEKADSIKQSIKDTVAAW